MPRQKPAFIWCEIVCRTCATAANGRYTRGAVPRKELVADAKAAGWLFKHHECFCSEQCVKDFEAKEKPQ